MVSMERNLNIMVRLQEVVCSVHKNEVDAIFIHLKKTL